MINQQRPLRGAVLGAGAVIGTAAAGKRIARKRWHAGWCRRTNRPDSDGHGGGSGRRLVTRCGRDKPGRPYHRKPELLPPPGQTAVEGSVSCPAGAFVVAAAGGGVVLDTLRPVGNFTVGNATGRITARGDALTVTAICAPVSRLGNVTSVTKEFPSNGAAFRHGFVQCPAGFYAYGGGGHYINSRHGTSPNGINMVSTRRPRTARSGPSPAPTTSSVTPWRSPRSAPRWQARGVTSSSSPALGRYPTISSAVSPTARRAGRRSAVVST